MATRADKTIRGGEGGMIFNSDGYRVIMPTHLPEDAEPMYVRLLASLAMRMADGGWCQEQIDWADGQTEGLCPDFEALTLMAMPVKGNA